MNTQSPSWSPARCDQSRFTRMNISHPQNGQGIGLYLGSLMTSALALLSSLASLVLLSFCQSLCLFLACDHPQDIWDNCTYSRSLCMQYVLRDVPGGWFRPACSIWRLPLLWLSRIPLALPHSIRYRTERPFRAPCLRRTICGQSA